MNLCFRRSFLLTICVTLLGFVHPFYVFADSIIVRANPSYYPVTYKEGNHWYGMDTEVLQEIFARADLSYDVVFKPFKRSLIEMERGEIHVIPNLTKSNVRSKYMHWLGPIRTTCIGLVVRDQDADLPIKALDDLVKLAQQRQQKVGYLSGASYSEYFDDRLKNEEALNAILYFLPRSEQYRKMLKLGRIVGYFYDDYEFAMLKSSKTYGHEHQGLALLSYRVEGSCTGAYIGISKELDMIRYQQLKGAFQSMKTDGSFTGIQHKWLGTKPVYFE